MNSTWLVAAIILFGAGFATGLFIGQAQDLFEEPALEEGPAVSTEETLTTLEGEEASRAREGASRSGIRRTTPELDHDPDADSHREPTAEQALADLRDAIARGDRGDAHEALQILNDHPHLELTEAQLGELRELLARPGDVDLIEPIARALLVHGGAEGAAAVLALAEDGNQSLEARHRAIRAFAHLPPEMAEKLAPSLETFIAGSNAPLALREDAIHAYAELHGNLATEALLDLHANHPGLDSRRIFGAIAEHARPEDRPRLLELLGRDLPRREKFSLLEALGRMAAREGRSDSLLDMLAQPPAGVTRSDVARMIAGVGPMVSPDLLREALGRTHGDHRAQAELARSLLEASGPAALEVLESMWRDPANPLPARVLAEALHDQSSPESLPFMLELIEAHTDHDVIEPLARRLFHEASPAALDELFRILETGNAEQRSAIAGSLEEMPPEHLPLDRLLGTLQREPHPEVTARLTRSLYEKQGVPVLEQVSAVLDGTSDPEKRRALLHGLEEGLHHQEPAVLEVFTRTASSDPVPGVRVQAARLLAEEGGEGGRQSLQAVIEVEQHPRVRTVLEKMLEPEAEPGGR